MLTEENQVIDMPSYNHSIVQSNLAGLFYVHYRDQYRTLTQPTVLLNDWESEPDLAIFPKRPVDWRNDEVRIKETPLIVIEIISPRQALQDISTKCQKYFASGVASCWVVNPIFETIWVYTPDWKPTIFSATTPQVQDKTLNIEFDFQAIFS